MLKQKKKSSINKFSSRLGFIAAASGAAIGLGNIWKFPYETGANGGACFLLIYLAFTIILGYPIVLVKTAFGRSIGTGVYHGYKNEGLWKYLSMGSATICLILFSFYSIITGWILGYGIEIIKGTLFQQEDMGKFFNSFINNIHYSFSYNFIVNICVALIIALGVQKGVERFSKVLMPVFMVMLFALILYALTLDGVMEGLRFYLLPDISLISKKSFLSALSQACLSLTIGASVMITYGAYAGNNVNLIKDTTLIVVSDVLVAFLAGLLIFPLIFHNKISPNGGPALIFIALPYAFKSLSPLSGIVIGVSFFILLVFAALTSAVPMLEVTTNYIMQRYKISRKKSVLILSFLGYTLGIPSILSQGKNSFFSNLINYKGSNINFMDLMANIVDLGLPLIGLLFCIFIFKRWDKYKITEELNKPKKNSEFLIKYVRICVCYVSPVLMGIILLLQIVNLF